MDIEKYLGAFQIATKDPTLEAMYWIMDKLNNPHKKCKFIHVAGTNGKGSVVEMLNSILIKQGYIVGKYISPHLIRFNERICVNNKEILDEDIDRIISYMKDLVEEYNENHEIKVKYFEITTCLAFIYFLEKNCDFVILETGMGGLWDCTNIVHPLISVITSIGYDHMDLLGDTIEKITIQKAGIIKKDSHTVFLKQNNILNIIKDKCKKENNTLHIVDKDCITNYSYTQDYQIFTYKKYENICINLKGKIQIYNASICLECINILISQGYKIDKNSIRRGLKNVVHKARFEILSKDPLVIYDGAHNECAIKNFLNNMDQYYANDERVYIISILKTKDYETIIRNIARDKKAIMFFTDGNDKSKYVSKEELATIYKKYSNNLQDIYQEELEDAIKICMNNYKDHIICIIGSFYTYENALKEVEKNNDKSK